MASDYDSPGDELHEALLQEIAKRALRRVTVHSAHLHALSQCRMKKKQLDLVGEAAAVFTVLKTPRAVTAVLSPSTLALIAATVGGSAMSAAIAGVRPVGFDEPLDPARVRLLKLTVTARVAKAVHDLTEWFPDCGLDPVELHDAGSQGALVAMLELPPPMFAILDNETIAKIAGMAGWNRMFDVVDETLSRGPPGRRMPE